MQPCIQSTDTSVTDKICIVCVQSQFTTNCFLEAWQSWIRFHFERGERLVLILRLFCLPLLKTYCSRRWVPIAKAYSRLKLFCHSPSFHENCLTTANRVNYCQWNSFQFNSKWQNARCLAYVIIHCIYDCQTERLYWGMKMIDGCSLKQCVATLSFASSVVAPQK